MRILSWHVHGAWSTAFVHGDHDHVVPVVPGRGADGRGRARTYGWPDRVREATPAEIGDTAFDVVVLQRPDDERLLLEWTGLRAGRDVPAVYVEHNAPQGRITDMRHPVADRRDLTLVHVTHFNALFWDAGSTPTRVIEHGVPDPGARYTGTLPHAVVVANEAPRRGRVVGADLLGALNGDVAIDLFGIDSERLGGHGDVPHDRLLTEMARRRMYLHPVRWTSLGLSLVEAMHLGMPVVALATTETAEAVPAAAGVVSNRVDRLRAAMARFRDDPVAAADAGRAARAHATHRFGLRRFLEDWDRLLEEVAT